MPYNILVVDDEPDLEVMMRQRFRKQIKSEELNFAFASNGIDALNKMQSNGNVDLILTDINMPEMDGLTLLSKLKELKTITKTVVVSAYGDIDNIRIAMNRGAFDFLTKPLDFDDLDITMNKTLEELQIIKQSLILKNQLLSIQKELEIAKDIQTSMLPGAFHASEINDKIEILAQMKPAKEVGGDLYDYFYIDDNRLCLVLGDVSGKGVPSAMFMAMSRMLVKSTSMNIADPAECIKHVNNILAAESISTMFVTLFYAIIDVTTGEMQYVNAGHNPPYILRNSGKLEILNEEQQLALGIIEGSTYTTSSAKLETGEMIFLFTDGVTEAFNKDEDLYGEERLEQKLQEITSPSPVSIVEYIMEDVAAYSNGFMQSDDITVLALKYNK